MRNRVARTVLVIGLVMAAAAHVLTYAALGNPDWISLSLGLVVIAFLAAVCGLILTDVPRTKLPSGKMAIVALVLVVYAIVTFVQLHQKMGGTWSLEQSDDKYLLSDGSKVVRVLSKQEYWAFEGLFFRTWSSVAAAMTVFGLARLPR